ncbi:GDSL lipase/esterase [Chlamydoabsidia padenii]|nr:GDSL lipase/esterase [Chlamydoabsidia padenii]
MNLLFIVVFFVLSSIEIEGSPRLRKSSFFSFSSSSFDLEGITRLFSFGDSYTTEYLDLPTMTYPNHDNVSSTNGANWVYYFTQEEDLTNWDLAYNSAPIENTLVNQNSNVIDLNQQITQLFPKYFLQNNTHYSKDETLYSIWVGINDVGLLLTNTNKTSSLDVLMRRYRQLISFLYNHEARNIILINVPPIDRSPKWAATEETASTMHRLVKDYNQKLLKMARSLSKKKHLRLFFIDAWSIFTRMMDHPHQYGFKNVTGYCPDWRHPDQHGCLPIKDYFWINDLHATSKVHYHFAKAVKHFLQEVDQVGV